MRNELSTAAGNDFLETLWLAIPFIGIFLTFLTAYLPGGDNWWWFLRVVVIYSVDILLASFIAASGVDYHDSRNSGVLARHCTVLQLALAAGAANGSRWRADLEKEPWKKRFSSASFYVG